MPGGAQDDLFQPFTLLMTSFFVARVALAWLSAEAGILATFPPGFGARRFKLSARQRVAQ
jgi:hypothetical protein